MGRGYVEQAILPLEIDGQRLVDLSWSSKDIHEECNMDAFDFSGIKREAKSRGEKGSFVQIAL